MNKAMMTDRRERFFAGRNFTRRRPHIADVLPKLRREVMTKWKDAFIGSIDTEVYSLDDFAFGPPATDQELDSVESAISAKLPRDLVELLREFNGVKRSYDRLDWHSYFFATTEMQTAGAAYDYWGDAVAMKIFRNVAWFGETNGGAEMWGIVVIPFATYQYSDIVTFDHESMGAELETNYFKVTHTNLLQFVGTKRD